MLLEVRREPKCPLLFVTDILVFLSIFTKTKSLSPFEALNSAHLSKCQRDVRSSVQKKLRTMAFSSVSTGNSDIPSFCEIKMSLNLCTAVKVGLLLTQGISGSIPLEEENTESLSHTHF